MIPKIVIVIAAISSVGYSAPNIYDARSVNQRKAQASRFDLPKPATFKEPAFPHQALKPISSSSYNPAESFAYPSAFPSGSSNVNPLPTRFETPAPATFKQPAFPGQSSSSSSSRISSSRVASNVKPLNLPSRFETPEPATFKQPAFPGQSPSSSQRTSSLNLPSRFETPAPSTFKQPAFPGQSSSSSFTASSKTASNVKPLNLPSRFETPEPATFKQPAFPGQSPSSSLRTSSVNLPSRPETPALATFNQPAFTGQTLHSAQPSPAISSHFSYPAVSYILKTPEASSTPLRSPSFPEATHISSPVYQAYIPTVPDSISGLPTYYSFSAPYGR